MKKLFLSALALGTLMCGCTSVSYDHAGIQASQSWAAWKNKEIKFRTAPKNNPKQTGEKVTYFLKCVEKFAPYMLEEFRAIDKAMKWNPGTAAKLCVLGVDYKQTPPPHECTSWIIMPELTDSKQLILHKNRDSSSRYLTAERVSVPGKYSWIGNCNFGSFGTTSGINECALAVAMNSGPRSAGVSPMGMGTTIIARILLEQCANAAEAVELLEKIVRAKAYCHGKSGSTWFIADPEKAFLVEQDNICFKAVEVTSGLALRANAWHLPETIIHSQNTPAQIVGNSRREYAVRDALVNNILGKKKKITLPDVLKVSRINKFPEDPKCYPLCGAATITGTSFVIDREFPRELSYFVSTFGPPRHGFYLPLPLTLKELPLTLRNGSWSNPLFLRKKAKKNPDIKKLESIEAVMLKNHLNAVNEARKLLRAGGGSAKNKAAALLEKAFSENMKLAEKKSAQL